MGQEDKRREVVEEYLGGGVSLRELGARHGIGSATVHRWVKGYESGEGTGGKAVRVEGMKAMPKEVERLQRELYEARLHVKLMETMIEIAEEQMGIVIRKKSGAKR